LYKEHHLLEQPVALLTSIFANTNRDPKKKREPYKIDDFFLFQATEERNIPSSTYGAAAMELVKNNQFPFWALFVYKDLRSAANGPAPSLLCYSSDDVMVLAPSIRNGDLFGMIIVQESAYGEVRLLQSPCGKKIKVSVPRYSGKFFAEENASMHIL